MSSKIQAIQANSVISKKALIIVAGVVLVVIVLLSILYPETMKFLGKCVLYYGSLPIIITALWWGSEKLDERSKKHNPLYRDNERDHSVPEKTQGDIISKETGFEQIALSPKKSIVTIFLGSIAIVFAGWLLIVFLIASNF